MSEHDDDLGAKLLVEFAAIHTSLGKADERDDTILKMTTSIVDQLNDITARLDRHTRKLRALKRDVDGLKAWTGWEPAPVTPRVVAPVQTPRHMEAMRPPMPSAGDTWDDTGNFTLEPEDAVRLKEIARRDKIASDFWHQAPRTAALKAIGFVLALAITSALTYVAAHREAPPQPAPVH